SCSRRCALHAPRYLFSLIAGPPSFSLFPYTTLFRSRLLEQDVLRLDIAVQNASVVGVLHRLGHLPHQPSRVLGRQGALRQQLLEDRKSTRLNSSHVSISYAVFCLKKKNFNCIRRSTT